MKICVLGSAPSSVGLAPFKNTNYRAWVEGRVESEAAAHASVPGDFEIWGCSPAAWSVSPRATRWFEIHRWEPGREWFSAEYCDFLRRFKGPVYTGGRIPEIPSHVVYPVDEMEAKFSSYFMTSSLALMMALAIDTIEKVRRCRWIHQETKKALEAGAKVTGDAIPLPMGVDQAELDKDNSDDVIGMWGVDMAATEEYGYQRPGCQFFVLEAIRRGIGFYLPPESDLMRPMPVYGISEWDHNYIKLTTRARELNGKAQALTQQADAARTEHLVLQGQMQALNQFVHTWTTPYGMQVGMIVRQIPDTGLGSGITHYDGRPIERQALAAPAAAAPLAAMAESAEVQRARELEAMLEAYRKQIGSPPDLTSAGLLARMASEAQVAREHSALLQRFARPGEATVDTMRRAFNLAHAGKKKGAEKRRRR
jgi:hypothetical protein